MPAVVVAEGISIQERMPASLGKDIGPVLSASIETVPVALLYSKAPLSRMKLPRMEVVALLPVPVVIERIGDDADAVEVPIFHEPARLSAIVVVALARNWSMTDGAEEDA